MVSRYPDEITFVWVEGKTMSETDGTWSGGTTYTRIVHCRVEFVQTNLISTKPDGAIVPVRAKVFCKSLSFTIPSNAVASFNDETFNVARHYHFQTHDEIWL